MWFIGICVCVLFHTHTIHVWYGLFNHIAKSASPMDGMGYGISIHLQCELVAIGQAMLGLWLVNQK